MAGTNYTARMSVDFPTLRWGGEPPRLFRFKYAAGEYQHEIGVLHVHGGRSADFPSGTPVSVFWSTSAAEYAEFLGYVEHALDLPAEPHSVRRGVVRLSCVGATRELKHGDARTFKNQRMTSIIRTLVEGQRLDPGGIRDSDFTWPVTVQAGMSDWEFMVSCAKQAGMVLIPRRTKIVCAERKDLIRDASSAAPVFVSANTPGPGGLVSFRTATGAALSEVHDRTLQAVSEFSRSALRIRETGGPVEKPLFSVAAASPEYRRAVNDVPVGSFSEGAALLRAERLVHQLAVRSTVVAAPHPNVVAGGLVAVTGVGSDASNGLWYVRSVEIELEPDATGEMTLELGRDSQEPVGVMPAPVAERPSVNRGARLVQGKWVPR